MVELPWMGLGLSTNLGPRDRPDPWRLHQAAPGLFDFVEYSAPLDLEQARLQAPRLETLLERRAELPALFHPVHLNLWGPELEPEESLAALRAHLRAVGSPWVGNDVGWWHHRGTPFPGYLYLPPPLTAQGVEQCAAHALHVQAAIDVPLVLENPAVGHRDGGMHVLDFLAALHGRTGAPLLLDLGHLLAFQIARDLPMDTGLDGFPLEAVAEIHVAGGVISEREGRRFYADDHGQPVREELFELLERVLPRCTGLRALTFEADGHPEPVALQTLQRLRRLVPSPGSDRPPLEVQPGREPVAAPDDMEATAWEIFDRLHGRSDLDLDPVGQQAEIGWRLAVAARRIDRDFPLSRAICAPDREGLQRFFRSDAFRRLFDGEGRTLAAAFASWARQEVRGGAPAGAEVALAFESHCQGLLARAEAEPVQGAIAPAPGVGVGFFPVDLSELLFAARALRRHLADRASATGAWEPGAAQALAQVALRAPPGQWALAVRRVGGDLVVEPIEPALLQLLRRAAAGATPAELEPRERAVLDRAQAAGLVRIAG